MQQCSNAATQQYSNTATQQQHYCPHTFQLSHHREDLTFDFSLVRVEGPATLQGNFSSYKAINGNGVTFVVPVIASEDGTIRFVCLPGVGRDAAGNPSQSSILEITRGLDKNTTQNTHAHTQTHVHMQIQLCPSPQLRL